MDGLWAPKSPDLSFDNTDQEVPLHPQHQGYRGSLSHPTPYTPPASSPILHVKQPAPPPFPLPSHSFHQPSYMPRGVRKEESMQDADYLPDASVSIGKLPDAANGVSGSTLPPGAENIIIKNHFPVARIKRIMQADDDVGKVAQVTPVVVCEFFCFLAHNSPSPTVPMQNANKPCSKSTRIVHDLPRYQSCCRSQGAQFETRWSPASQAGHHQERAI